MPFQTGVVEALKDYRLRLRFVSGWQTRGSSSFYPKGHVVHHDVIGPVSQVPGIIVYGRSDLPGPLSQFWLQRDGTVWVVAAGRANHAGPGGWRGLSGNSSVWGTEMNNRGYPSDPWPDVQLDAMYRLAAATGDFSGFGADMVSGHKEWSSMGKVDPHTLNMNTFRAKVASVSPGGGALPDFRPLLGADAMLIMGKKDGKNLNAVLLPGGGYTLMSLAGSSKVDWAGPTFGSAKNRLSEDQTDRCLKLATKALG